MASKASSNVSSSDTFDTNPEIHFKCLQDLFVHQYKSWRLSRRYRNTYWMGHLPKDVIHQFRVHLSWCLNKKVRGRKRKRSRKSKRRPSRVIQDPEKVLVWDVEILGERILEFLKINKVLKRLIRIVMKNENIDNQFMEVELDDWEAFDKKYMEVDLD